jgi:hypothetical protein
LELVFGLAFVVAIQGAHVRSQATERRFIRSSSVDGTIRPDGCSRPAFRRGAGGRAARG